MQISEPVRMFLEKPNFAVLANTSQGRVTLRNMQKHSDVALAIVDRENPDQYVQIPGG